MRPHILAAALVAAIPLTACVSDGYNDRPRGDYGYRDRDRDHHRGDRYRDGRPPRYLRDNDQIYRGNDGSYYCKRDDGTTGTIVGAIAGGVLGNVIAPGGSKTLGTILGGAGGALAGRAIDKDDIRCE